jgi:hypothetical protein
MADKTVTKPEAVESPAPVQADVQATKPTELKVTLDKLAFAEAAAQTYTGLLREKDEEVGRLRRRVAELGGTVPNPTGFR